MVIVVNPGPQRSSALSGRDSATRLPDQGSFRQYPCQAGACRMKKYWGGRPAKSFARPNIFYHLNSSGQFLCYGSQRAFAPTCHEAAMPSFALPALPVVGRLEVPPGGRLLPSFATSSAVSIYLVCSTGTWPNMAADDVPSSTILGVLVCNLLLSREPLYAISVWATSFVPESLGLLPGQADLLNDDRGGRTLDHLFRSDRGSLFTAIVLRAINSFRLVLKELHQDTTTVTVSGEYADQPPVTDAQRPARITRGYNKDHRPDLKQLVYDRIVTADGAVPIRCNILDGNTADDTVHQQNWLALRDLLGHADFLYVADSETLLPTPTSS